jgi:excisionase family DNA binding protein
MAGTVTGVATPKSLIQQLESRKAMMNVTDVAELLGESIDTIYRRVKRGKMPHVRLGISTKFDPIELAEWLREHHIG